MLFADQKGWFVGIDSGVNIFWRETYAIMHVKPMGVDPVFWEILNMPENKSAPLSFRALGAWACKPVEFARSSIDECDMNPAATAHGIVEWADRELARAYGELTIDGFIARLVAAPEQIQNGRLTSTIVATLLMAGREDEAEAACVAAIDRGSSGSFFTGAGTFPEVALKHIQACRAPRALH